LARLGSPTMNPAGSSAEAFLRAFHDRRPGLTAKAFGDLPVTMQRSVHPSSYHLLADILSPRLANAAVLDLACGDGLLLSLLAKRSDAATLLAGIDLSEAELRNARQRLGPGANLYRGRAQALPFAPEAFTHVLCHLALMLMDDAPCVLREIRRVLVPAGIFGAVVGARSPGDPALDTFAAIFSNYPRRPEYAELRLGDWRMRSVQGLHELLGHCFDNVSVQEVSATTMLSPTQLWEWLDAMYDLHLLDEGNRCALRDEYLHALGTRVGMDGTISSRVCMRCVVAVAA
jgi:ubiquinone/menaquinone biosynthesis C-methylase UbiE